MVSITNVSSGQASSYFAKDDYYIREAGEWAGKGAQALGLEGKIEKESFDRLLNGKDLAGNELVATNSKGEHRAGVDLTFSAPKSLSVLAQVCGDGRLIDAHKLTVQKTLNYMEKNYSLSRQNGMRIETGNLVIAKFEHGTSRELDPQIHTHCVVMNMTQREDGEWRAFSNEKIYENKMLLGQIYRNELASEVLKLGYQIEAKGKGLWEIRGFDEGVLKEFSTRRGQIEKALEGRESGGKLAERVALATRQGKIHDVDRDQLKNDWNERVETLGHAPGKISMETQVQEKKIEKLIPLDQVIKSIEVQSLVWTQEQMLKIHLKNNLENGLTIDQAMKDISKEIENGNLLQINSKFTSRAALETEKNILTLAQDAKNSFQGINPKTVDKILSGNDFLNREQKQAVAMICSSKDAVDGVQGHAGTGKTTMLNHSREILEKNGYEVRGITFTGKAAETLQAEAGIKSQTLHSFLGERERGGDLNPTGKPRVWIVDEASMVGNKQMLTLLEEAKKEGAKVVLLGDKAQLQAIDAGKPFQILQEKKIIAFANIKTILRQKNENLKEAVQAVGIEKNSGKAIEKLDSMGAVREIGNREDRLKAVADAYLSHGKDMKNTLVVTSTNKDRMEINHHIRDGLKEKNYLSSDEKTFSVAVPKTIQEAEKRDLLSYDRGDLIRLAFTSKNLGVERGERGKIIGRENGKLQIQFGEKTVGLDLEKYASKIETYTKQDRNFSVGDRVIFTKNDRDLGVVNGSTGKILEVRENSLAIETKGGEKHVDLKSYDYLDHSYVVTAHKSQGQTVDNVILHVDTNQGQMNNANMFYVGISRAREDAQIFTDSKERLPEAVEKFQEKESALELFSSEIFKDLRAGRDLELEPEPVSRKEAEIEIER